MAEINKSDQYQVKTVGFDQKTVITMDGLSISPDYSINEINYDDAAILILPGGEMWEKYLVEDLIPVVQRFINKKCPLLPYADQLCF